ncbi:MAG: hypothetical protein IJ067_11570 [Prevotella sp.]|nr:hypothetical protein [Prevotella sp.]
MQINHWHRIVLGAVLFLAPALLFAQGSMCKDTIEHRRLQKAMWDACGGESTRDVYEAAKAYQKHANAENDLDSYYNAWVCGIVYSLDHMNIHDAYHITKTMKDDLQNGKKGKNEQFLAPNMLGQVYNTCGNIPGAIEEFKKAIELIKGTTYEASGLSTLYLGLAHICLTADLEQSMHWINEDIAELNRHQDQPRYYRGLANAHAFKMMILFKQHKYDECRQCYEQAKAYEAQNHSGSSGSFMPYMEIYKKTLDGQTEDALAAADKLPNHKDRYIVKCDIYRFVGQIDQAFRTQRQLMHLRDSISGAMIAENIERMDDEMRLMKAEQEATQRANIVLTIAVVLALLVILLMSLNVYNRRRYQKSLLLKNQELEEANRQVTAADQMKTEFIRNVSHEIRTPLNIINGFTEVLTDEAGSFEPEERRQIANTIGENTRQITSLVNKMLALANENTKNLLSEVEQTDALDICRRAIQSMPAIDPARIEVIFDSQVRQKDALLQTNDDSLLQMLSNLLENSVKFTEQGHIRLSLERDEKEFRFTVEDTGCGIPEDKIDHIFERFTKGDEFKEGLGLGLAYCYETAQKLGGTLRLDRTSKAGTTFTLSLPINLKTT